MSCAGLIEDLIQKNLWKYNKKGQQKSYLKIWNAEGQISSDGQNKGFMKIS